MENYWTTEKVQELEKISNSAFSKRDEYTNLWQQIATYVNLENKEFYLQKQNDFETDQEVNNSQASISLNQSSDSMLGILIGDGNFFKIKVKDNIEDIIGKINEDIKEEDTAEQQQFILSKQQLINYAEFVNSVLKEQFFLKESNFTKSLHKSIKEYFAFGNAGMGVFKNNNSSQYEESRITFTNYSVNNCAFLEGKNGEVENIFIRYKWTAKKIIETFCLDEKGNLDEKKLAQMPTAILNDFNEKNNDSTHEINYIFMRNPQKRNKALKGSYSANFVAVFADFTSKTILKCDYYKKKQIKIIRDNVKTGETYGKGLAGNILGEIKLLNKITGDTIENLENIVRPYLYSYENVLQEKDLKLDRNKLLILNPPQNNPSSQPPIVPLIQSGDVASTIQFLIPQLQNNIATGLKSDIFLDFNAKSDMTATETQIRNNIRNKVLFANALDFQNLLNCLIYNAYYIIFKDDYDNKKDDTIRFLEQNYVDWFDIEYTSELAQISKNSEIQSTINFLQTIVMVTQMAPQERQAEIIKRIDFNKVNETIASLYNKSNLLFSEEDFKQMMEQEKQALAQQNQAMMEQQQAETQDKQAQTLKTMAEANQLGRQPQDNLFLKSIYSL